jgi:hypothetical protein
MKKLLNHFGLAVVIAAIAFNALLITGCPDVGIDDPKGEGASSTSNTNNPPNPTTPPLDGHGKTIKLKANRWGSSGKSWGENWSSGDQIKLADFAGIKLGLQNTYSFRITGKSDKVLDRVQLQIFSGNKFETWLGSSSIDNLVTLNKDFDEVFSIKIEKAPTSGLPIIIQLNNIIWQKDEAGAYISPEPNNNSIPLEIEQDTVMATITDLSISLYDVLFKDPPEKSPVEERWYSYVNPNSTVTMASSLNSEGIMTAVVDGVAMPNVQDNWNAWRAQISYYYTAEANAQYTFKFEAWTGSGTRNLHLQYYENESTNTYLASDVPITSTRKTYEVLSDIIPTGGLEAARFILADQLGTVYIKIISIEKYVFNGGTLTVSNISGAHGLEIDSRLEGSTREKNKIGLVFGSAVDKYPLDDGGWHMYGKEIRITGDPINIHVWQVNYNTNTFAPFKGNITIPIGELELQQSHFKGPNNAWSSDDYYYNKVPISFTGGSAFINFGTQMEYDGTWFPGVNGGEGHYVSPYQITVTGVSGKTGRVNITVYSAMNTYNGEVFWGEENISGSSVTINLRKNNEAAHPFTGSGSYYLSLSFSDNGNDEQYYYTNGQDFASLDITQDSDFYEHYDRLPKCNITSMPFTIDLSKFKKRPERHEWYPSSRITTITITNTGITDYRGGTDFYLSGPDNNYSLNTKFSNGNITSYFLDVESNSYSLKFDLYGDNGWDNYVYTVGQTFASLGIASESDLYSNLPRYPISSGTTISINFNQFKKLPKPYEWYSSYKTITITGLDDFWGSLYLIGSNHYYHPVYNTDSWNGNSRNMITYWVDFENYPGSYYLELNGSHYNGSSFVQEQYVYTNGSTLASLGIHSTNDFDKLPKFTVTTMPHTTTIDFSKFQKVPSGWLP